MPLLLSHELELPGATGLAPLELRARMEERFAWAVARGHAVAALVCDPLGLERVERRTPGSSARVLGTLALALEPVFQVTEALVQRADGGLVVLLVGPDPLRMEAGCRAWVGAAKELRLQGDGAPLGLSLRLGYGVTQPGKRLFLDTLLEVAREGLRVALFRGPGACVHTMLYDTLQHALERERGSEGLAVGASAPLPPGAPAREPGTPPATGDTPRGAVQPTAGVAPPRSSAVAEPERRERELLAALDAQRRENDDLRARLQLLERQSSSARAPRALPAAPSASEQGRIELLERRLVKLRRSLAETEERLARAAEATELDSGLASCHRTVQGLDADAPDRAQKSTLLEQIFAANVELRESLRAGRLRAS